MGYTRQQYEDRIRARLGDLGVLQLVDETQIPLALEDAFLEYGNDQPRHTTQTFAGDGATFEFDLTVDAAAAFDTGWSSIVTVEWPAGERVPQILDHRFWTLTDGVLRLLEDTPAVGQNIVIRHTAPWPYPTDDPDIDVVSPRFVGAIAARAASHLALNKALEYARRQSSSVAGDLHTHDPTPLFEAHRILKGIYEEAILGRTSDGDGGRADFAFAVSDVQPIFPNSLFHQRRRSPG